jgi:8-oxo-dGTP pyrophosphatase MutT (NUDIX family)
MTMEPPPARTSPALEAYFAGLTPTARRERTDWVARLRLTSYVTDAVPPTEHVRSVRCVAFRGRSVLALRDAVGAHILPGGRREAGETLARTLERELLEETGWTVSAPRVIGVVRLSWLQERPAHLPAGSPYYPDFLWLIHTAEVDAHRPEALLHEPGEGAPVFLPLSEPATAAELEASTWAPENRVFLPAALRRRPARRG